MADSQMYSSVLAAQDVARGACIVAWPADEPYTEPTSVAHISCQPRFYAGATNNGNTLQASTSYLSLASCTLPRVVSRSWRRLRGLVGGRVDQYRDTAAAGSCR